MVPDVSMQSSAFKTWGTSHPLTEGHNPQDLNLQKHCCGNLIFWKESLHNSLNWLARPSDYPFVNFRQHSFCTGPAVVFTFKTTVYTYIQEMFNSISQQSLIVSVRYTIQCASFSTYYGCLR